MNPPYRDQSIKVPQTAYWSRSPARQKRGGTDGPESRKISHGPLVMLMLPDELRAGDCLTVRQNELANVLERKRGQRIRPGLHSRVSGSCPTRDEWAPEQRQQAFHLL